MSTKLEFSYTFNKELDRWDLFLVLTKPDGTQKGSLVYFKESTGIEKLLNGFKSMIRAVSVEMAKTPLEANTDGNLECSLPR